MSFQCFARALSSQIRGCSSCGGVQQLKLFSPLAKSVKPAQQTSLVTRVQHFKTSAPQSFKTSQPRFGAHGSHSTLWTIERVVSASLMVTLPLAVIAPNKLFDVLIAVTMVLHSHWGIEAIAVDYVRPIILGPVIPKLALGLVYILSVATLAGLLQITFNDKGIGKIIQSVWVAN